MKNSNDGVDGRPIWAINGRFVTQRMTGVQRYAYEIVASLDEISSEDGDIARRLGFRLVLPPGADVKLALSQIDVHQTKFGSGQAWDQFVLPWCATSGVLSLGNFGPVLAGNHIVCIHDANTFIEPESYSRAFGLAYRTLLPLIGKRASRVALIKMYGPTSESAKGRYSPAECIGARKTRIEGNPDIDHVSASYAERSNLSVRMHTRRFTRLTNGFSKKVENHAHSVALFAMYYNFVRVHKTLRMTPAMAANVIKRLWEMSDIVDVLEAWEAK
jgi:hypothetical protein